MRDGHLEELQTEGQVKDARTHRVLLRKHFRRKLVIDPGGEWKGEGWGLESHTKESWYLPNLIYGPHPQLQWQIPNPG